MTIEIRFRITREAFSLDVDFKIPSRGVTAVFGPSGCGKTTLLRAIAGLDKYDGGNLKIENTVWQDSDYFMPAHKRPIGYVFQEVNLFAHLNVRANLDYGMKRIPAAERNVSLETAIELLGLGHLMARRPDQLSGGEQQRVAIARALVVSPRLLLMDEPLAALDAVHKHEIMPYLESLHSSLQIPIIYVSHSTDEVTRLADSLVLMDKGKVLASGDIKTLFTRLDLSLAHDIMAEAIIDATVVGYDEEFDLTHFEFEGGRITVSRQVLSKGKTARMRIAARDVSLTLSPQTDTSILNIIPVIVDEITEENTAQVTVRLLAGNVPLLSRITRKSAFDLKIKSGKAIFAQVKSVALL